MGDDSYNKLVVLARRACLCRGTWERLRFHMRMLKAQIELVKNETREVSIAEIQSPKS